MGTSWLTRKQGSRVSVEITPWEGVRTPFWRAVEAPPGNLCGDVKAKRKYLGRLLQTVGRATMQTCTKKKLNGAKSGSVVEVSHISWGRQRRRVNLKKILAREIVDDNPIKSRRNAELLSKWTGEG